MKLYLTVVFLPACLVSEINRVSCSCCLIDQLPRPFAALTPVPGSAVIPQTLGKLMSGGTTECVCEWAKNWWRANGRLLLAEAGYPLSEWDSGFRLSLLASGMQLLPQRGCAWRRRRHLPSMSRKRSIGWAVHRPGPRAGVKPGEKEVTKTSWAPEKLQRYRLSCFRDQCRPGSARNKELSPHRWAQSQWEPTTRGSQQGWGWRRNGRGPDEGHLPKTPSWHHTCCESLDTFRKIRSKQRASTRPMSAQHHSDVLARVRSQNRRQQPWASLVAQW